MMTLDVFFHICPEQLLRQAPSVKEWPDACTKQSSHMPPASLQTLW